MNQPELPVIRSSERADFKRCPRKWYWAWRKGLVPKAKSFGALDLGTWMHSALAAWYGTGRKRNGHLVDHFSAFGTHAISAAHAEKAPDYVLENAETLVLLGEEMAKAYERRYGQDRDIRVLAAEIPLEFIFEMELKDGVWVPVAVHKIKPDLVFMDSNGDVWLMEHKTAKQIQMEHLVIDDQARPYGAMAERSLRKMKVLKRDQQFRGILYNFLRKALPDERPQNSQGKYLNKDMVTVSKRQPPPYFVRHPVTLSRKSKIITLKRVQRETIRITETTLKLRRRELTLDDLGHTPHKSCPKFCPFFTMCVATEEGTDTSTMERAMYVRRDPYEYEEETADDPIGFEIG